jgi:Ca-activated chloride channel family protein
MITVREDCGPSRPRRAATLLVAVSASLLAPSVTLLSARQAVERRVYVSVVDQTGAPVTDVTAADFLVREDGAVREVLRVSRAADPMDISVLLDDTQAATPAIADIRRGLQAFVTSLHQGNQIALVTFGERPTIVTDYTSDLAKLTAGVNRLFARPDAGSYLLEAILDTTRGLQKREAARPVIVAVTTEGEEFSNDYYVTVLEALRKSRAQFHALVRASADVTADPSEGIRNRNVVLADGTLRTGGRREYLLTDSAFATKLPELALELKSQLALVYARPESLIPPEKLEVTVRRPGLTVRAATVTSTP